MRFAICTQMLRFKCFIKLSAGLILDDICYCVLTTLFDLQKKHCNKCERKTFYKFSTLVVSSLYAHMMCVLVCFASFFFRFKQTQLLLEFSFEPTGKLDYFVYKAVAAAVKAPATGNINKFPVLTKTLVIILLGKHVLCVCKCTSRLFV